MKRLYLFTLIAIISVSASPDAQHEITVSGTTFRLNGEPFQYTGVSDLLKKIYHKKQEISCSDIHKLLR